ncbi:MAG: hypothetical protein GXO22_03235 [Aquificae bacterium]|nr:hypothetical protein [Aquificota bacterium]
MKIKSVFLGILIIVFQTTVLFKAFSIGGVYPSLIKVFLMFLAFRFDLKEALKYAFLFGIVEDLYMNQLFMYNIISNLIIVSLVEKFKYQIDFDILLYGLILTAVVSITDFFVKTVLILMKTGIFYISAEFIVYTVLNIIVYLLFKVFSLR